MGRWLKSKANVPLALTLLVILTLDAVLTHGRANASPPADPTPTPTPMRYGSGFFLPDGRSGTMEWAEQGGLPQNVYIASAEDVEQTIVELTNQRRAEHGLPPLKVCPLLTTSPS